MMYVGHIGHFILDIIVSYQQHIHRLLLQDMYVIKYLCKLQIEQKQTKSYVLQMISHNFIDVLLHFEHYILEMVTLEIAFS